jgi:hypothetical protein
VQSLVPLKLAEARRIAFWPATDERFAALLP